MKKLVLLAILASLTLARAAENFIYLHSDPDGLGKTVLLNLSDLTNTFQPSNANLSAWSALAPATKQDAILTVKATTGDVTNSTTTAAKITSLDTTTGTGTFTFQYFVRYQTAFVTNGVKFSVNHTGTVTSFVCNMRYGSTGGSAATAAATQNGNTASGNIHESFTRRAISTAANMGPTVSADAANSDMLVILEGLLVATVSGDLQLYHASEVAQATSVRQNSVLILTKI